MQQTLQDIRRDRISKLEQSFTEAQTQALSFISETETQSFISHSFLGQSTPYSTSYQYSSFTIDTQSKARKALSSLENIESRYRKELKSLRNELKDIERKNQSLGILSLSSISLDQNNLSQTQSDTLDCLLLPDLIKNESDRIVVIENDITQIERLLSDSLIEELEQYNHKELKETLQIEAENKIRKRNKGSLTPAVRNSKSRNPSSFSQSSQYSKTPTKLPPFNQSQIQMDLVNSLSALSNNDSAIQNGYVQEKIATLIKAINKRKLRYQIQMKKIKMKENELKAAAEKEENILNQKEEKIRQLTNQVNELNSISSLMSKTRLEIDELKEELSRLIRAKEDKDRRNYTIARDKHEHSEAVKRLKEIKGRVNQKKIMLESKRSELDQRRELYNKENELVNKRMKVVDDKNNEVTALYNKLSEYGIDFKNKIVESQRELEARDLAAALRPQNSNSNSLEQQLIDLINTASNDD